VVVPGEYIHRPDHGPSRVRRRPWYEVAGDVRKRRRVVEHEVWVWPQGVRTTWVHRSGPKTARIEEPLYSRTCAYIQLCSLCRWWEHVYKSLGQGVKER